MECNILVPCRQHGTGALKPITMGVDIEDLSVLDPYSHTVHFRFAIISLSRTKDKPLFVAISQMFTLEHTLQLICPVVFNGIPSVACSIAWVGVVNHRQGIGSRVTDYNSTSILRLLLSKHIVGGELVLVVIGSHFGPRAVQTVPCQMGGRRIGVP